MPDTDQGIHSMKKIATIIVCFIAVFGMSSCKKDMPIGAHECAKCDGTGYNWGYTRGYSNPILKLISMAIPKECYVCSGNGYTHRLPCLGEYAEDVTDEGIANYDNGYSPSSTYDGSGQVMYNGGNSYYYTEVDDDLSPNYQICRNCNGSGNCRHCHGAGEISAWRNTYDGGLEEYMQACPTCRDGMCISCGGEGKIYF